MGSEMCIRDRYMFDTVLRGQLMKMLDWYVGVKTDFTAGTGNMGKHLEENLEPGNWNLWLRTYADSDIENTWDALDAMCALFRIAAGKVAVHFGFPYPLGDDQRVGAHLKHVRSLPLDAEEIY